jgi:Asp-tRNA(Asn)/Glu-tRNA(Gln) amidotransferase A subunit family amidase
LGDKSLCSGTLSGWGSAPGAISIDSIAPIAISIDFTAIFFNVAVSHDEEGVVLP